jgi:predicted lactoylglutathione lyase
MSNPQMIFINLPVADLDASKAFYTAIGFTNERNFTDETASAMVLGNTVVAMLLTHSKWRTFTTKAIPDAKKFAQVMIALGRDSRDAVDALVDKASRAGGHADCNPVQDYGFMYGRSFEDLDGHIWESFWMDPAPSQQGGTATESA